MAVIESNQGSIDAKTKDVLRKTWTRYSNEIDERLKKQFPGRYSTTRVIAAPFITADTWSDVTKALNTLRREDEESAIRVALLREVNVFIQAIIDDIPFDDLNHVMDQVPEFEQKEHRARVTAFLLMAYKDFGTEEVDNIIDHTKKLFNM
jgi:hypothetical protein